MDINDYKENYKKIYKNFEQALVDLKLEYISENALFLYNEKVKATLKNGEKVVCEIKIIDVDENGKMLYYLYQNNTPIMYSKTNAWFIPEKLKKLN